MAKTKDNKKVAFYKQRRKSNPKLTDAELRSMWNAKVEAEKSAAVKA